MKLLALVHDDAIIYLSNISIINIVILIDVILIKVFYDVIYLILLINIIYDNFFKGLLG